MEKTRFEKLVEKAIADIPETFSRYIENLVFVVEEEPDDETLLAMGMEYPDELLGLYLGDPLTERTTAVWGALPDQIILYQKPIELYSLDYDEPLVDVIRDTILHEVGHYFGLSEEDLARMGLE